MTRLPAVLVLLVLVGSGCPKRTSGEIDVDAVQEQVDAIDAHLAELERALRAKDLDGAAEHLEDAEEILSDEAELLAAYPELGELRGRVSRARDHLCATALELALGKFYSLIRAQRLEQAAEQLPVIQERYRECRQAIAGNSDYLALKMSAEGAAAELQRARQKLAAAAERRRIEQAGRELEGELGEMEKTLAALEKSPNQPGPARKLEERLAGFAARVQQRAKQLGSPAAWAGWQKKLVKHQQRLSARLAAAMRRGRILALVKDILPRANRLAVQAAANRDRQAARRLVQQALGHYRNCLELVGRLLAEEPGLRRFRFSWRSARRTVGWLRSHCQANQRITARMLRRLGGRAAPSQTNPPAQSKPADRGQPPAKKKKKPKRRRGRIRRW